jgi:serine beta-lactamase-like protein LACTB
VAKKNRAYTWLAVILVIVGIIVVAIPSMWVYMKATATILHPNPKDVPAEASQSPQLPKWTSAVEQARQAVRAHIAAQNLPGLSVAVGSGGDIVWAEGFGFADLDQKLPVTPYHRFRIGTASIVLTSAAAGLLIEQGRLKLDDTIQTYVPAFPKKQWPVTLRHLMSHVSGLPNDGGDEGPLFSEHCSKPVDAIPHFAQTDLRFEPGTKYRYSRYGWIAVSAAIEAAAQKPFLTYMREAVFDPLGMRDTVAEPVSDKPVPDRVISYFPRFAADPKYGLHLTRDLDFSCYAGSSVFLSTPTDLARFGLAINNGKLLQPATVQMLQTSQRLASGQETGYGLGWDLETVQLGGQQTTAIGHDGDVLGGTVSSLMTFPKQGIVVSVMSNISYSDTPALALKIAQAFAERGKASVSE